MTERTANNLLTDIAGIRVGHAQDKLRRTGVTAVLFDRPVTASGSFLGGAPALRDTALLEPENSVKAIHGIVLSGGSVYGLDATGGVQAFLHEQYGSPSLANQKVRVPIVVQAALFDLVNGGDKEWGRFPPYRDMGYEAAANARSGVFALGTVGAGTGANTATIQGGIGSASAVTPAGHTVSALIVVNAVGSATIGDGPYFWSAPFERDAEFGGLGFPQKISDHDLALRVKANYVAGTTIGIIATDATLTKPEAKRLAIMSQDGVARGVYPAHLSQDGDAVFGIATGERAAPASDNEWMQILHAATQVTARAIARGVYEATPLPGNSFRPTWTQNFGTKEQST